jgi:phage terminase large subunit
MLPEASQARKAIWDAVNPHTGKRRIDEAFPLEIRATTKDQEMMIKFVNGSTWQVVGSDNFNSLVGSPPAGIVYSEWALANPSARAYLRPILAENGGWQIFITTPRGNNHAKRTYEAAKNEPGAFAQLLTVRDTGAMSQERMDEELRIYIADFGIDAGTAKFEQEYMCSFDAALLGAYYGAEFRLLERRGGVCRVDHDLNFPVYTAWDLGYSDDTGIWWYQVIGGEVRVLEYYGASGKDPRHYFEQITGRKIVNDDWFLDGSSIQWGDNIEGLEHRRKYQYAMHSFPHDAKAKTFASMGRSVQEMAWKVLGEKHVRIVPGLSVQDGIQAVRTMLPRTYFDSVRCVDGVDALKQYQREWDDDKKVFRERPRHDWTSHPSDAFRMLAIVWQEEYKPPETQQTRYPTDRTIDELIAAQRRKRQE